MAHPARKRILVADNDDLSAQSMADFLTRNGYEVQTAASPEEAREKLQAGRFALAIIDVRLQDNEDPSDTSGVEVAYSVAPTVPKILVTRFDEPQFLQRVLDNLTEGFLQSDSEPASIWKVLLIRLFPSEQRYEVLFRVVRQAIWVGDRVGGLQRGARQLLEELAQDHAERRRQAWWTYRLSVSIGLVGVGLVGLAFATASKSEMPVWSILAGLGGVFLDICSGFLWKIAKEANRRMDESSAQIRALLGRLLDIDVDSAAGSGNLDDKDGT